MITEERMETLLIEANPIPDPGSFDMDGFDRTAYLATLEKRGSEMTQTQTKKPEMEEWRRRRSRPVIVGLAVAVLVAVVLVLALPGSESTPIVDEPSPVSTTTTSESDSTEFQGFTGNEPAGTYKPALFQPMFAFTLSRDGWKAGYGAGKHFSLSPPEYFWPNEELPEALPSIFFASPDASTASGAETVQDVLSWVSNHPSLEDVTEPVGNFTIGGIEAQVLTAIGASDSPPPLNIWGTSIRRGLGGFGFGPVPDHSYVFYVLEVDGAPVVITVHYYDSEHAESLGPEVEEILNSIRWQGQG